ncbi:MAG: NAD(P)/FAD-dependent oxidoreductase [Dehalococcoidia bacterium]|nr:MAG: NAD(P)/FAD-dependent oxidoreductase [Dehalococcoidia bacterium]
MPDATYDVVIAGGGCKALYLAMYLTRYAGMSVGVFERRHELGGGLATEETAAPGFRGNTHANLALWSYWLPLYRDFPEFWEYGAKVDQYPVSGGASFLNNETCVAIYSEKVDPTQEKSAAEIARFSGKDAETWLKLSAAVSGDAIQKMMLDLFFIPADKRMSPEVLMHQAEAFAVLAAAGVEIDGLILQASGVRATREFFESKEMQYLITRGYVSAAIDPSDATTAIFLPFILAYANNLFLVRGGTHQVAHAAHQILVHDGCKFHTHAEVTKVLIENGTATGVRLADGSEIKARKLVITAGLSAGQVVDIVGRDVFGEKISRRVDLLSTRNIGCLMWYTFALNEAPSYITEAINPDMHACFWHMLASKADPEHAINECRYAKMGKLPPLEDYNPTVWCHSLIDPSYAPPGKHVAQTEMQGPPAAMYTEREWIEIKKKHMEDLVTYWSQFAPNMTWDNIIGVDSNSPYDCLRMKNLEPDGNFAGIDMSPCQRFELRPIPELAAHRTPVKNLYCTGGHWPMGVNMGSDSSYTCYKVIAEDHDLAKPWEEPGKEEPDSLLEERKKLFERVRDEF